MNNDELRQALETRASRATPGGAHVVLGAAHAGPVVDGPHRGRRGWLAAAAVVALVGGVAGSAIFDDPVEDEEIGAVAANSSDGASQASDGDAGVLRPKPALDPPLLTDTIQDVEGRPLTGTAQDLQDILHPARAVRVLIANGTAIAGAAVGVRDSLTAWAGYRTFTPVNATEIVEMSSVYYDEGYELDGLRVAQILGIPSVAVMPAVLPLDDSLDAHLLVLIGVDFDHLDGGFESELAAPNCSGFLEPDEMAAELNASYEARVSRLLLSVRDLADGADAVVTGSLTTAVRDRFVLRLSTGDNQLLQGLPLETAVIAVEMGGGAPSSFEVPADAVHGLRYVAFIYRPNAASGHDDPTMGQIWVWCQDEVLYPLFGSRALLNDGSSARITVLDQLMGALGVGAQE